MSTLGGEYVYSLYNPDNGVELYESLEEAERMKNLWLEVVPVDGPFTHARPEAGPIKVARRAVTALAALCRKDELPGGGHRLQDLLAELERTLDDLISPTATS